MTTLLGSGVAHLLGAESIALQFPTKTILTGATLGIADGDRIGIVGRNGDGKSTLMRLLAGKVTPDSGRVTTRRGLNIGFLDQADLVETEESVHVVVTGGVGEHVWAGDARIRSIIDGLLAGIDWHAPVRNLSGGQRRRVALAQTLAADHDVIMLDEPTNHLDIHGVEWLANHIKTRWSQTSGGFMVVTHDRWFLDEVCTTTWEVHDGVVDPFEGGYAAYVLQRVERDRKASVSEAKRQNLMRKELAWLRRGPPARTSKPKFRIDAANALIAEEPPIRETVQLQQLSMQRLGRDVLELDDVTVGYNDNEPILRNVTWNIAPGERAGILGINGAGKSTLLKVLTGELQPTTGKVRRGKTTKVATLSQHALTSAAQGNELVRDVLAKKAKTYVAAGREISSGQLLEQLGFKTTQLTAPVRELSGGQRRRLQLLMILLDEPNVLILDEPTNDMDTDMLTAIEDLLDTWPGTLLVVSHDRYLIERITDVQYAVINGRLQHLPGGVDQYLAIDVATSSVSASKAASSTKTKVGGAAAMTNAERLSASKEFASVERKLAKIPMQIEQLEQRIASHDQSDYEGLTVLAEQLIAMKAKRDVLEHRWLELSEALD